MSFSELNQRPFSLLRSVVGEAVGGAGCDLEVDLTFEGRRFDDQADEAVGIEAGGITFAGAVSDVPTGNKSVCELLAFLFDLRGSGFESHLS